MPPLNYSFTRPQIVDTQDWDDDHYERQVQEILLAVHPIPNNPPGPIQSENHWTIYLVLHKRTATDPGQSVRLDMKPDPSKPPGTAGMLMAYLNYEHSTVARKTIAIKGSKDFTVGEVFDLIVNNDLEKYRYEGNVGCRWWVVAEYMMRVNMAKMSLRNQLWADMSKQYTNFDHPPWNDQMEKGRFWDVQNGKWKDS